jgi:hypothetical protein
MALLLGHRGLPGGETLARFLNRHRDRRRWHWSAGEDRLVRSLRRRAAARRTGRTLPAVYSRRRRLGMPDGRLGG